jgi:hypothetical protein
VRNLIPAGLAVVGLLSLAAPTEAIAVEAWNGNQLYTACTSDALEFVFACKSYIIGVGDLLDLARQYSKTHAKPAAAVVGGWHVCMPLIDPEQAIDIVKNYLTAHPEERHYGAADIVAKALQQAFPCRP